jgi:hypothetical protein
MRRCRSVAFVTSSLESDVFRAFRYPNALRPFHKVGYGSCDVLRFVEWMWTDFTGTERLRKTTKCLIPDSWFPGRDA